jgi:hypothetical protein
VGHQRLGSIPDTAPWRRVVALVAEGEDAAAVATATTEASLRGLDLAASDKGLAHTLWLLTQVVLASRQADFAADLRSAGIQVAEAPDVFELVGAFSDAVDRHLLNARGRTDIGEMAQLAAVESLSEQLKARSRSLFEISAADLQRAVRELSTQRGFATLAHDFFGRFTARFLTYHLGRELSSHVGGNGRFADSGEHDDFVEELHAHCEQATLIVRDYAGDWYSKARFEDGVSPLRAKRFVDHCLRKLSSELRIRGSRDG